MTNVKDVNKRINGFAAAISKQGSFNGCKQFGKLFKLIMIEAPQTDGNERCNHNRKTLVNGHNLNDLQKINDRISIIKNTPDPCSPNAYKLYVETLKVFDNEKDRNFSVEPPKVKQ